MHFQSIFKLYFLSIGILGRALVLICIYIVLFISTALLHILSIDKPVLSHNLIFCKWLIKSTTLATLNKSFFKGVRQEVKHLWKLKEFPCK